MSHLSHCRKHPDVEPILVCPACLGSKTSQAKAESSARNGKLGGRPPNHLADCKFHLIGSYTKNCPRCKYDRRRAKAAR